MVSNGINARSSETSEPSSLKQALNNEEADSQRKPQKHAVPDMKSSRPSQMLRPARRLTKPSGSEKH